MFRYLITFILFVTVALPVQAEFDESIYARFTLDEMIENFRSIQADKVEIVMFRPIAFEAEVVSLPVPKKTDYVQRLIRDFNTAGAVSVTHGMQVRSPQGQAYNLYVMDELVPQVEELLQVGDKATLYTYHAFNADTGPGLILHSFLRHDKPGKWQQFTDWASSLFAG